MNTDHHHHHHQQQHHQIKFILLVVKAVAVISEQETHMRAWLLRLTGGGANPLMDHMLLRGGGFGSSCSSCSRHLVGHVTQNYWMSCGVVQLQVQLQCSGLLLWCNVVQLSCSCMGGNVGQCSVVLCNTAQRSVVWSSVVKCKVAQLQLQLQLQLSLQVWGSLVSCSSVVQCGVV